MEEELAEGDRRPSMYDPARDIFAKEQEQGHDGSAERGTRDNSTSHDQGSSAIRPSTAISRTIASSHLETSSVRNETR